MIICITKVGIQEFNFACPYPDAEDAYGYFRSVDGGLSKLPIKVVIDAPIPLGATLSDGSVLIDWTIPDDLPQRL